MSQSAPSSQTFVLPREIAGIRIPDTALAKKALDLSFRVSPAVVHAHALRTFVFGALVGQAQKLRPYDEELFFLAAVLHDPTMRRKLADVHMIDAVGSTPSELATFLAREIETYSAIVKAANIKAE